MRIVRRIPGIVRPTGSGMDLSKAEGSYGLTGPGRMG